MARRLHSEVSAFLAALPAPARNASGLARHLGIDRTTCQRAVFAVARPYDGTELLSRLPGVRGLQQIVEAASAARPAPEPAVLDALAAAISQYQELITSTGGSHTRLLRRIARGADRRFTLPAAVRAAGEREALDARSRLFEAAATLTGRSSSCWIAVYVYSPSPGVPGTVDVIRANGLAGHVARADAVPLVIHNFTSRGETGTGRFVSLENAAASGRALGLVLQDFTTDPPPLVTSRQPDEFLVQSIDEHANALGHPVDLMLAARSTIGHPARHTPSVEEVWALVNFPCRHLLFDVYLHRDLARTCLPSLDTHLWGPDFAQHAGDRWRTRFADSPPLQLLGPGLRQRSPDAYPRMAELSAHLFGRVGLQPGEFIGYRCEVDYPIWRAGYCVSLDFTRPQPEGAGEAG